MTLPVSTFGYAINNRWILLVAGLLLCSTGVWVLISPFQSYLFLSRIVPIGIVITGILELSLASTNQHFKRWLWWLIAGIIDIVVGIYLYNNSLVTILLLPVAIGLWTGYKGCMAIGEVLHLRKYHTGNWRRLLFVAMTIVVLSAMLMACPLIGIENIFMFSGLALIATGSFRIYWGVKFHNQQFKPL